MKTLMFLLLSLMAAPLTAQEMQVEATTADGKAVVIDYTRNVEVVGYDALGRDYITLLTPSAASYTILVNGAPVTTSGNWGPFTITSPPVNTGFSTEGYYTMYVPLGGAGGSAAPPATQPTSVPEPGTFTLMLFGFAGLFFLTRLADPMYSMRK